MTGFYDAYDKDIATASFFFIRSTAIEFGRHPRMTWIDFVSQVGSLLGLFMGFSWISAFELVHWFVIRKFHATRK